MADQQIVMQVPEAVVKAQVQAAVASVLNRNPEALVRAVVEAAMRQKDPREYRDVTLFDTAVSNMIREEAKEALKLWIDEQRPAIRKAVYDRCGLDAKKLVKQLADAVGNALTSQFSVNIKLGRD